MCARLKPLFEYDRREDFNDKLTQWIGDVFYDILPEHGYEVRDEQIYTAFKIADAICNRKTHLAEAGLGTGKTFAYLLPSIAYARLEGKPIIIACASTALQEQLCGDNGDIQSLSDLLGLDIDARMAKDSHQYVCDVKVDESLAMSDNLPEKVLKVINEWLYNTGRGERSEIPQIPDTIWNYIGWEEGMSCETCLNRGYCKLIKAKEYYRAARDIIVVDHDLFFKDLWTRGECISEGKLPILPDYCGVFFDEGHKIILPAAIQAGNKIKKDDMDQIIYNIEQIDGARESLLLTVEHLKDVISTFFIKINQAALVDERSERFIVPYKDSLYKIAKILNKVLDKLLLELQIEQELYMESLPKSLIQGIEMQIDEAMRTIHKYCKYKGEDTISWVDRRGESFYVVPKNVDEDLRNYLFQKQLPSILTSATLSNDGDFSYLIRTLGIKNPSVSTTSNSFLMEEQMEIYISDPSTTELQKKQIKSIENLANLLLMNKGRALVLTNSLEEVRRLRKGLEQYPMPFPILWEDTAERGYLIRTFKEEEATVLVGSDFWEGIDVPGDSLTMVIIWQLPFPALDPLVVLQRNEVKRKGLDEKSTIDYPAMGLRLKQGCGRLIRSNEDRGKIVIMDSVFNEPYEKFVISALPKEANIKFLGELLL